MESLTFNLEQVIIAPFLKYSDGDQNVLYI